VQEHEKILASLVMFLVPWIIQQFKVWVAAWLPGSDQVYTFGFAAGNLEGSKQSLF
jgi:hypothetical protein